MANYSRLYDILFIRPNINISNSRNPVLTSSHKVWDDSLVISARIPK